MPGNQVRLGVGVQGAKQASSEVDQLRDRVTKLRAEGAKGLAIGAGVAVAQHAFGILDRAVSDAIGFAGDAAQAYIADEQSITRLGVALKQNVPNWDGQTAAIEKAIKANIDLGFSDDDQRNALATLVAATHDSTEALQIESVAMDLARAKGISLADASQALTSIEAGRSRGLATLGINVKDYATTAERLAAVEKVVGGQAAAYADTLGGKVVVAQTRAHEAEEKLGKGFAELEATILPAVADGITTVVDALDNLAHSSQEDAINRSVTGISKERTEKEMADAKDAIEHGLGQLSALDFGPLALFGHDQIDQARRALLNDLGALYDTQRSFDLAGKIADDLAGGASKVADGARDGIITPLARANETARHQMVDSIRKWPRDIHDALTSGQNEVESGMQELLDAEKNPISPAKRIAQLEAELTGKAIAEGLKSSDPFVRTAAQDEATNIRHQLEILEQSAPGYGARTGQAYAKGLESQYGYLEGATSRFLAGARDQLRASSPPGPKSPLHEIDKWGERTGKAYVEGLGKGIASGGDVGLGDLASNFPGSPRHVSLNNHNPAGGGGDVHLHFHGIAVMTPGAAEELARHIEPIITRTQQRRGHLAPARVF